MKLLATVLFIGALASALGETGADIAKQTAGAAASAQPEKSNLTLPYRQKIVETIFKNYNKDLIPDGPNLKFGMALITFNADEDKNVLESTVWLRQTWTDSRLSWSAEDFGGVTVIRYNPDLLWKPDILPYNSDNWGNLMMNCNYKTQALLYSTGTLIWVPPCKLVTHCNLQKKKSPFDEQMCTIKFGSWTYDGYTMDVDIDNKEKPIDLDTFWHDTSKYEIISTAAEKNTTFYDCCPEPYHALNYNITFKRLPEDKMAKLNF